jgi:dTDP-4-dehydrorhamnose reductase
MTEKSLMRLLIIGGDGMLGHQLWKHFRALSSCFDTRVTLRRDFKDYRHYNLFHPDHSYSSVDVRNFQRLIEVFADFKPNVVINCVGIVKQRPTAKDSVVSIEINALLPHKLSILCEAINARLIHPSTDCVFSGQRGNYTQEDSPDPSDLYGQTKLLGEVNQPNTVTLRTSIIGFELDRKASLVEWFINSTQPVKGFQCVMYNGLSTIEISSLIEKIITEFPHLHGLHQVSSQPISKYELLCLVKEKFNLSTEIIPDSMIVLDRTLDSSSFRRIIDYHPPSWSSMITTMAKQHLIGTNNEF